ncbi:tetratricopeptide repeat protein [Micromonospora musae]|uniref:Tetratricopeptide repeat protein n=1 Tax=Micromonospora musae TaxID=1894970 RepID=A0ABX9QT38_9ACTN|nr:tetratricopeptide repeat protein [Micromonospora musae]RKN13551.1 tetratricopeptide repeat protein [Micromonospora musae]
MPSGFGDLTDQAHHLVSTGDLAGAQRLLSDALSDADPRPANATIELADAASLQARVLVALGEPHSARGWAAFAYAAHTRLHGHSDPRTVAAAATLAAVLHRVGSHSRAARLYQDVIIELTAQDGPESLRVLAAHADLATVEYARGQCRTARDRLQDAWELHREVYGDGHPSGIKMLARLGAMQRDCGQFAEAHDNLALARELCRQHLPAEDPLAAQVATLARAPANPEHSCPEVPDAPVVPAARTPSYGEAPAYAPPEPEGRTVPVPRQPVDDPTAPEQQWWPPEHSEDPAPDRGTGPWGGPGGGTGTPPFHDDGPQRAGWTTPAGDGTPPFAGAGTGGYPPPTGYPPPAGHAPPTGDAPPADHTPPTGYAPSAGQAPPVDDAVAPAGSAVPPAVMALGGGQDEADGVHRVRRDVEPYRPSRLLPVPVHRTPAPPGRRLAPLVVAGVVVVLLGAAAVIAGVSRVGGGDDPPSESASAPAGTTATATTQSGAPSPTVSAVAPVGAPPTGVNLRDNRDNVALRWTYPAGGEGPVVISGGRTGQPKSALTDLPAGTTGFIVYGLSPSNDYCFTVAVVWSTDTVAAADEVCTQRR